MPLFFSGIKWLVLEGKDTPRIKVFGSLHLLCFYNSKSEIGEWSLKWNGMRVILQTQWLRIAHGLQAVLKARSWRCSFSFSSLFSKPSTVKAFSPISGHIFYWTVFSRHCLWRMTLTCGLWWIGWNMSFVSQKELVSVPGSVILLAMYEENDHTY